MAAARRPQGLSGVAAALLLSLFAGCRSGGGDAEAIRALIARETEAMNKEDLQALSEIWSKRPEIVLIDVPPPGRFRGWESIARSFGEFFDRLDEIHLEVDAVQVEVEGPVGYATWDWALSGRTGEISLVDRGQATAVYRWEDGGWKLVHAHYSAVPAAQALEAGGTEARPPAKPDAAPGGPPRGAPPGPAKADAGPAPSGPR